MRVIQGVETEVSCHWRALTLDLGQPRDGVFQISLWGSVSSLIKGRGGSWRMKVRTRHTVPVFLRVRPQQPPPTPPPAPLPPTSPSLPSHRGAAEREAGAALDGRSQLNSEVLTEARGLR